MKKATAWVGAWSLYWLGHWVSCVMNLSRHEWLSFTAHLFPLYARLMLWSGEGQEWAGLKGPWVEVKSE
jgi:hypothetical protein